MSMLSSPQTASNKRRREIECASQAFGNSVLNDIYSSSSRSNSNIRSNADSNSSSSRSGSSADGGSPRPVLIVVSVLLSPDNLSRKTYSTWEAAFKTYKNNGGMTFKDHFASDTEIIIVDEKITVAKLHDWAKVFRLPKRIPIVKSTWIGEAIRNNGAYVSHQAHINKQLTNELLIRPPLKVSLVANADANDNNKSSNILDDNNYNGDKDVVEAIENQVSKDGKEPPKKKLRVENFMFFQSGTEELKNKLNSFEMNNKICNELLDPLSEYYGQSKTVESMMYRAKTYRGASLAVKSLKVDLTVNNIGTVLHNVKGIGKASENGSIFQKIKEFITTGQCEKKNVLTNTEKSRCVGDFVKVFGIGPAIAESLFNEGCRTIADLREKAAAGELNPNQTIGLKYYEDLNERIPRDEVTAIGKHVGNCLEKLIRGCEYNICGSYRRGKPSSGDVDVIISPPIGYEVIDIVDRVVYELTRSKFLVASLTRSFHKSKATDKYNFKEPPKFFVKTKRDCEGMSHIEIEGTRSSYMGICKLPGDQYKFHRRIDIKSYPRSLYAFGLLYFTGSDYFNRSMRSYAHTKGLSLSDKGIAPRFTDSTGTRLEFQIKSKPCETERDIFSLLNVEYKQPHERNCLDDIAAEALIDGAIIQNKNNIQSSGGIFTPPADEADDSPYDAP